MKAEGGYQRVVGMEIEAERKEGRGYGLVGLCDARVEKAI